MRRKLTISIGQSCAPAALILGKFKAFELFEKLFSPLLIKNHKLLN
jgi:hypothetical protein